MKITSIETLRTEEFANVLWVRVHTDSGIIGLGETFGAGAVEAHIHDTLAGRLLGRDPLHIEAIHRDMVNLPMAQSSTGAEYRAASAIDIEAAARISPARSAGSPYIRCSAVCAGTRCGSTTPGYNTFGPRTSSPSRTGTSARPVARSRISTTS